MSGAPLGTITIPERVEHDGYHQMTITVPWACIFCGGPRGEPFKTISWDGSRTLGVDGWHNACGHVEKYSQVRAAFVQSEAA